MLCQECSKKETCQELCPEAEIYVSQDHIPKTRRGNLHPSDSFIESVTDKDDTVWDYQKERYTHHGLKYLIIELHLEGKSTREIAYHLPCTQQYVQEVTSKFKAK